MAVLAPDVVFHADMAAQQSGSRPELRGADAVAANFHGRARAARPALIDGVLGLAVAIGDSPVFVALRLSLRNGLITAIEAVANPERLSGFGIQMLDELPIADG